MAKMETSKIAQCEVSARKTASLETCKCKSFGRSDAVAAAEERQSFWWGQFSYLTVVMINQHKEENQADNTQD